MPCKTDAECRIMALEMQMTTNVQLGTANSATLKLVTRTMALRSQSQRENLSRGDYERLNGEIAALANAGTLAAFIAVGVSLIVLRVREPNATRPFHAPLWPLVGAAAIIALPSVILMMMFGQTSAQKTDMAKWLADSKADWKIAIGHHPYKSNGPHGNAGNYEGLPLVPVTNGKGVKDFLEDNICGKVDLYLCGHDHSRQWLNVSCKGTELAVSGAGSKVTEFKGNNPSLFQSLEVGFLYIVIEGKTLTAEFIDEDGKSEFTHTIKKP